MAQDLRIGPGQERFGRGFKDARVETDFVDGMGSGGERGPGFLWGAITAASTWKIFAVII